MIGTIRSALCAALGVALAGATAPAGVVGAPMGAIAMHGEPALPPDFDTCPMSIRKRPRAVGSISPTWAPSTA